MSRTCGYVAIVFMAATFGFCRVSAQTPAKPLNAHEIMQKTLAAYTAAKTYQASWNYTLEQGERSGRQVQRMTLEIKSKAPNRLSFRLAPAADQKTPAGRQPLPELRVIVDGKAAWFENTSEKTFYRVVLPKNAAISPLMFMPLIPSASQVERKADIQADGKTLLVLSAMTPQGGTGRMEIDSATYHIRRVATEALIGLSKTSGEIVMDKETFDGETLDTVFIFKPSKGAKETPAPPEATGMFGPPDSGK